MKGEIIADLATIPVINIITIGIVIICGLVVVAILIKKLGLSIGAIKPSVYEYDQFCQTEMFHLQEKIADLDKETKINMRRYTKFGAYSIAKICQLDTVCTAIRNSMIFTMKEPLLGFVTENHFTKELTETGYESYRTKVISSVRDTYYDLTCDSKNMKCDVILPDWEETKDAYIELIDSWLYMAVREVRKTCLRKIQEYERVLKIVENNKNWKSIVENCIKKNNEYIDFLTLKGKELKNERRVNLCYE